MVDCVVESESVTESEVVTVAGISEAVQESGGAIPVCCTGSVSSVWQSEPETPLSQTPRPLKWISAMKWISRDAVSAWKLGTQNMISSAGNCQ